MKQLEELVAAISHRVAETMSSQLRLRYYDFGDKLKNNMMMVLQKGEKIVMLEKILDRFGYCKKRDDFFRKSFIINFKI